MNLGLRPSAKSKKDRKEIKMTINFTNKTIELTTAEMKKASVYNSDAYKALREAHIDNPSFLSLDFVPNWLEVLVASSKNIGSLKQSAAIIKPKYR